MIIQNRMYLLTVLGLLLTHCGCSPYGADKQVNLPIEFNQVSTIELVDLRPESEKTRTDFSGKVSVADDRQFNPNKVEYLKNELSKVSHLSNLKIELISFKHTLDTRPTAERFSAGAWAGAVGAAIAVGMAPEGKDSIQCEIVLKINDKEFTGFQIEYFTLGTLMTIEWEKLQLRDATKRVTIACINEIVAKLENDLTATYEQ